MTTRAKRQQDEKAAMRAGRRATKRAGADTITVEDVANRLGIGRNQAYETVKKGKIPAIQFGRRWLIARATVDRILSGEIAIKGTSLSDEAA
jgi:excisionase family DNA binding protein